MEFIFELLFEIIVEGAVQLTSHKKVPMPIRILAFLVCFILFGGIIAFIFAVAYSFWMDKNTGAAIIFAAIGIALLVSIIYMIRKQFKEHNQEKNDETPVGEANPTSRKQVIIACISAVVLIAVGTYIMYTYDLFE